MQANTSIVIVPVNHVSPIVTPERALYLSIDEFHWLSASYILNQNPAVM